MIEILSLWTIEIFFFVVDAKNRTVGRGATCVWSVEEMRDVQSKILRLRDFVTPDQRRNMRSDFENGLDVSCRCLPASIPDYFAVIQIHRFNYNCTDCAVGPHKRRSLRKPGESSIYNCIYKEKFDCLQQCKLMEMCRVF